jgi:alpha-tubulin suppressor-like RCC1 family protein
MNRLRVGWQKAAWRTRVGSFAAIATIASLTFAFGGFGEARPFTLAAQQVNTAGGLSVTSVVLSGDPGGTALTETVNGMLPGDYRERVVDLTVPYDADVTYSVKGDLINDGTPNAIEVSQANDARNTINGSNAGLSAADASDLTAPAGQGGLMVEVYRCTGTGNAYESTTGVIASATDDREVSCRNAGVAQGAKGNGTAVTQADVTGADTAASITEGDGHGCIIRPDGSLWCWGRNWNGGVGDGTTTTTHVPVQVGTAYDWTRVDAGAEHTCGIRNPGTLWCWGWNNQGQIGDGTMGTNRLSPVQIGSGSDWTNVSAGYQHTCGLRAPGTLWCWGDETEGKVGNGSIVGNELSPLQIGVDTNWASISVAGFNHSCAIKTTGTLWCWGDNSSGQLGDGTWTQRTSPTQVGTDTNWLRSAAEDGFSCAVKTTGTLWCWGNNWDGRLGDGTTNSRNTPGQVGVATDWAQVMTRRTGGCAVKLTGTLWCWGQNSLGEVGDGTTTTRLSPVQVGVANNWAEVRGRDETVCGRRTTGLVECWGTSRSGMAGNNFSTTRPTPVQITGTSWTQVANSSYNQVCAIRNDGTLWCWGANGCCSDQFVPTQVGVAADWTAIALGEGHACGIRAPGTMWCWGANWAGQLGDGTNDYRSSPVQVGVINNWVSVTAGMGVSCSVRATGTLWCWGRDAEGQLGNGLPKSDVNSQTQIGSDSDWLSVDAYENTVCGRRSPGSLWCWGANGNGQVGDGAYTDRESLTRVGVANDWTAASVGRGHTCGIRAPGSLWCWGNNSQGPFGTGNQNSSPTPVQSGTDTNWAMVDAGDDYSCARRTTGTLWCVGRNAERQLGIGWPPAFVYNWTQVGTSNAWTTISASPFSACGLQSNNTISCWGQNDFGQIGDDGQLRTPTAVAVPLAGTFSTPVVARPAGQTLRLLIRVRLTNDGTTDGRQNVLLNEQVTLTHRFALVDRARGGV